MECCDQNDLGCVRLARRGAGRTLNEAWLLYRTALHRGSKLREAQISFDFALRRLRKVQFDGRVLAIANRIDGDPCKTCLRRLLARPSRADRPPQSYLQPALDQEFRFLLLALAQ